MVRYTCPNCNNAILQQHNNPEKELRCPKIFYGTKCGKKMKAIFIAKKKSEHKAKGITKVYTEVATTYLTREDKEKLDRLAKAKKMTKSDLIRNWIEKGLSRNRELI